MDNPIEILATLLMGMVPFLLALTCHEYAHGLVAKWFGDRTAEISGRLTLNPVSHIDPIGTLAMPIIGILTQFPVIGWAKPVPVDERNLKHPVKDMFWIALAGPGSNVLMAIVAAFLAVPIHSSGLMGDYSDTVTRVLMTFMQINLFLAVFNMIPFHPLDGGKVVARFLPYEVNRMLEDYQMQINMILLVLFMVGGFAFLKYPVQWMTNLLIHAAGLVFGL